MKSNITNSAKTIERLQKKADSSISDKVRMPSISEIAKMLIEFGIEHSVSETRNMVEYKSAGNRYVNSRHDGKKGKELIIKEAGIFMDTSESYYSWNTQRYAFNILKFLKEKGKI